MVRVDLERNQPVRMLNVLHAREEPCPIWSTPYASDAESTRSMPAGSTSPAMEKNKKSMLTRRASSLVASRADRAPAAKLGVKTEEP